MWTPQNRKRYDRSRLRYPSDLRDEEWAHVAPLIPPAKPGGNKRTVDVREVMNGEFLHLAAEAVTKKQVKHVVERTDCQADHRRHPTLHVS
jgi:hypothetical protein